MNAFSFNELNELYVSRKFFAKKNSQIQSDEITWICDLKSYSRVVHTLIASQNSVFSDFN